MIKSGIFLSILSLASMSPAQAQEISSAQDNQDSKNVIVVIAPDLKGSLQALQNCIDNGCPPDEDIDATLAHAENLFIEGDYQDARSTIEASIKRNKKFAPEYTIEVADLYRSNSRVLEHLGLIDKSNFNIVKLNNLVKKHSDDDRTKMIAELELAGARLRSGSFKTAIRRYNNLQKEALEKGYDDLAAISRLREISIKIAIAKSRESSELLENVRSDIMNIIREINDPDNEYSQSAEILLARLNDNPDNEKGNQPHNFIAAARNKPILLSSNPVRLTDLGKERPSRDFTTSIMTPQDKVRTSVSENFLDRWADFGFFVNTQGRVEDVELLRLSGSDNWVPAILKSIESRIYAPRVDENNMPVDQYIIERFTYTAQPEILSISRIRTRSGTPIIRTLDLTVYD